MKIIKGDLHLSANDISGSLVKEMEALGFQRDTFINNIGCADVAYHATYRGASCVPDKKLWDLATRILSGDSNFFGCLEEEVILADEVYTFSFGDPASVQTSMLNSGLRFESKPVPPGTHKACDIHLSIDQASRWPRAISFFDSFNLVSFEKPMAEGNRKVYTLTCEYISDGLAMFELLKRFLCLVGPVDGKMKIERTSRFFRQPDSADYLPIMDKDASSRWIQAARNFFEVFAE